MIQLHSATATSRHCQPSSTTPLPCLVYLVFLITTTDLSLIPVLQEPPFCLASNPCCCHNDCHPRQLMPQVCAASTAFIPVSHTTCTTLPPFGSLFGSSCFVGHLSIPGIINLPFHMFLYFLFILDSALAPLASLPPSLPLDYIAAAFSQPRACCCAQDTNSFAFPSLITRCYLI